MARWWAHRLGQFFVLSMAASLIGLNIWWVTFICGVAFSAVIDWAVAIGPRPWESR